MKNKKMLAACLGAAVLVAGFGGVYLYARPQTQVGEKSVQVRVIHSDQTEKEFTYQTEFEYLGEVLEAEALVVFQTGPYGMFIEEVDGERAVYEEDGAYWALYEGEEYAVTGADQTPVEDSDGFSLVYTVA